MKLLAGLTNEAVALKQKQFGANVLANHHITGWSIFIRQFKSSFVYLLLAAASLALLLGEYIDGTMVIIFVLVNAILGFWQEYRSEKTSQLLKKLTTSHAKVRRDGKEQLIPSAELVPGDVLIVSAGDVIGADAKLLSVTDFQVNETVLTGESVPIPKQIGEVIQHRHLKYQARRARRKFLVAIRRRPLAGIQRPDPAKRHEHRPECQAAQQIVSALKNLRVSAMQAQKKNPG